MRLPLIVALVVAPTLALADGDDMTGLDQRTQEMATSLKPDARAHFITASKAFNAQDYKTASPEYETAYKLDPEVPLLMSWAQSERLAGNCPHALELYQKYLYSEINERQVEFTRQRIKECGGVVPTKPVPPPITPPKPIASEPSYVWYKDYPADGLTGAGVIGLLVGTIYFIKSNDATNRTNATLVDFRQSHADVDHDNKIGTGGMIIGGALAIAGVGIYIYHWQTHGSTSAVTTDGQTISFATRW